MTRCAQEQIRRDYRSYGGEIVRRGRLFGRLPPFWFDIGEELNRTLS